MDALATDVTIDYCSIKGKYPLLLNEHNSMHVYFSKAGNEMFKALSVWLGTIFIPAATDEVNPDFA